MHSSIIVVQLYGVKWIYLLHTCPLCHNLVCFVIAIRVNSSPFCFSFPMLFAFSTLFVALVVCHCLPTSALACDQTLFLVCLLRSSLFLPSASFRTYTVHPSMLSFRQSIINWFVWLKSLTSIIWILAYADAMIIIDLLHSTATGVILRQASNEW